MIGENKYLFYVAYTHFSSAFRASCVVIVFERKALAYLSGNLSPTYSVVESGCLLSSVVFHHVHSPFWHAFQLSVCVCAFVCKCVGNTRCLLPSSGRILSLRSKRSGIKTSEKNWRPVRTFKVVCVCGGLKIITGTLVV